jgi:hypothetical protein
MIPLDSSFLCPGISAGQIKSAGASAIHVVGLVFVRPKRVYMSAGRMSPPRQDMIFVGTGKKISEIMASQHPSSLSSPPFSECVTAFQLLT